MSNSLWPHGRQHSRPPCPTICQGLLKFMSIASLMPFSHLILWWPPLLCPPSFPALATFPMSWLFASDDQNTGISASVSVYPTSSQGWFPLRLTGFISLLSKGFSRVFFSTTVLRHQFFDALPSLPSNSHNHTWPLRWLYVPFLAE